MNNTVAWQDCDWTQSRGPTTWANHFTPLSNGQQKHEQPLAVSPNHQPPKGLQHPVFWSAGQMSCPLVGRVVQEKVHFEGFSPICASIFSLFLQVLLLCSVLNERVDETLLKMGKWINKQRSCLWEKHLRISSFLPRLEAQQISQCERAAGMLQTRTKQSWIYLFIYLSATKKQQMKIFLYYIFIYTEHSGAGFQWMWTFQYQCHKGSFVAHPQWQSIPIMELWAHMLIRSFTAHKGTRVTKRFYHSQILLSPRWHSCSHRKLLVPAPKRIGCGQRTKSQRWRRWRWAKNCNWHKTHG